MTRNVAVLAFSFEAGSNPLYPETPDPVGPFQALVCRKAEGLAVSYNKPRSLRIGSRKLQGGKSSDIIKSWP